MATQNQGRCRNREGGTGDVRRIKTERGFRNALVRLLLDGTPFANITVADICTQALASRSTFYDHYLDKYDLLAQMVEENANELGARLDRRFAPGADFLACFGAVVEEFYRVRRDELKALLSVHEPEGDLSHVLEGRFAAACRTAFADTLGDRTDLLGELFAATALSLMRRAVEGRMRGDDLVFVGRMQDALMAEIAR